MPSPLLPFPLVCKFPEVDDVTLESHTSILIATSLEDDLDVELDLDGELEVDDLDVFTCGAGDGCEMELVSVVALSQQRLPWPPPTEPP